MNNALGDLFSCRVGEQWLGLPVDQVLEVVNHHQVTPMPFSPPYILGLMNLRGQIITQVDVRVLTGLDVSKRQQRVYVVIVRSGAGESIGLVVDEVGAVGGGDLSAYEKIPDTLASVWQKVGEGVIKDNGRVMVIVNVDRLLELSLPSGHGYVDCENTPDAVLH